MISRIRQLMEGRAPQDLLDMALALPLGLGALGYYAGYEARRAAWSLGLRTSVRPAVPVISVGNLTLGGTGKTPFTIWLAEALAAQGRRPAILSRGYARRRHTEEPLIVSDGQRIRANANTAGDEPFLMAAALEGVPVIVGKKRRLAAAAAIREFAPGVLLLDDGFQHWALERHVNLVLWDGGVAPGATSLFPMGPLREPLSALRRASAIIVTRPGEGEHRERVERQLERLAPGTPRWVIDFAPEGIVNLDGSADLAPEEIKAKKFYAFCALARPQKFLRSIEQVGTTPAGWTFFGDHYYFEDKDLSRMAARARAKGADALITTAKDAVKLHDVADRADLPIYVLSIQTKFEVAGADAEFLKWLEEKIVIGQ